MQREGVDSLIVLCDTTERDRIDGTRYRADWMALAA
jgi:hypothetical protein